MGSVSPHQTPPDRLTLRGLTARGRHGVLPAETELGQPFVVDVELELDVSEAAASDDVARTVDYSKVAEAVVGHITGEPVALIETLAVRIAEVLLQRFAVDAVVVTVHKPQAPLAAQFDDVAVTVRRVRS